MDIATILIIGAAVLVVIVWWIVISERRMSPEDRAVHQRNLQRLSLDQQHGQISPQIICPHCQTRGTVRTKAIKKKAGISGGKATAALLTGGVSLLATGLARKEALTQAHCENCNSVWSF
jgi:hypothetical protein